MANWLDKYEPGGTVAKTDATRVAAPAVKLTKAQLEKNKAINKQVMANTKKAEAKEVQDRKDRIAVSNAVQPYMYSSPKNFAVANSAIGDKLRVSEQPNFFDDYINPAVMFGHFGSGLAQIPLNIQQGDYKGAAMNVAAPIAAGAAEAIISPIIGKATTAGKKAIKKGIDQTFTKTGKELARIEKEGIAKGLSPHEIKMQQMDQVGITSAQREGYIPGVSDLAYKYITPYGYEGTFTNKFIDTWRNIKAGGVHYEGITPARDDSFRLYLGMPQQHGTFEMAQTAPIQHVAYTPKQLEGLEIFSIKKDKDISFPTVDGEGNPRPFNYNRWWKGMDYLEDPVVVNSGHDIMGGHNQRLTKAGLEYNDVWDLEPPITPYKYLPRRLKSMFDQSPLFFTNTNGTFTPRQFKIPVDKFLGKPFMAHGVNPNLTSTHLVDKMKNAAIKEITVGAPESYQRHLDYFKSENAARRTDEELGEIFKNSIQNYNNNLKTAKERLKLLEGYPKFKDGGEANYNDYSVTVPPNYEGEGYFNEGRDYSPAWGGQFEDGGELPQFKPGGKAKPIIVTNPKDRRLKAYNDSLTAYNLTQKAIDFVKNSDIKTIDDRNKVRNNPVVNIPLSYKKIDPTHWEFAKPKTVNEISKYEILIPGYKKPTQPVIYQERVYQKETPELQDLQAGLPVNVSLPELHRQAGPNRITMGKPLFPGGPQTDYYTPIDENGNVVNTPEFKTSQFAMGGSIGGATQGIPGATGFMYARNSGSVPSKGKGAKKNIKTVASAQVGKEIPKINTTKFLPPVIKPDEEVTKPEPQMEVEVPTTPTVDPDVITSEQLAAEQKALLADIEESERKQAIADWLSQQAAAQRKQEEEDRAYRSLEGVSGRTVKDLEKQLDANKQKYIGLKDYSVNKYHSEYDEARFGEINLSDVSASKKKLADYINSPLYAKRQDYNPEQYYGEAADIQGIDERDFQNDIARQKREARLTNLANSAFEITKERSDYYKPASNALSFSKYNDSAVISHELGHNITSDPYAKTPDGLVVNDAKGPMLKEGFDKYSDIYNSKSWDVSKTTPKEDIQWGYGYTGYGLNKAEVDKFVDFANPTYGQEGDPHYDKSFINKQRFAGEQYGDLMALRELMHKYGITNTFGEDIDKGKVDKALKNKNITTHPSFKRFYQRYGPNGIIQLNNTIAANNPQQGAPMAQNGAKMTYYQNGLDFQPKSISKNGKKIIKDDMGQWAHPGEITEIDSNQITMQGVPYPVLGISDTGDMQMMYPNEEYQYIGDSVTEYPMMKQGGQLTKLDQLTNFTNYNTKQPGGWLDKYQ